MYKIHYSNQIFTQSKATPTFIQNKHSPVHKSLHSQFHLFHSFRNATLLPFIHFNYTDCIKREHNVED